VDNLKNYFLATALTGAMCLGTAQISFGQNLIVNGTFTSLSLSSGGQLGANVTATDWSTTGYNFVFPSGDPGDTGVTCPGGNFSLWGPTNGSANGMALPPGGSNVVAADGAYEVGPITQVISGFEWAAGQQYTFTGNTTESWSVALGAATGVFTAGTGDNSGTLAGGQTTTAVHLTSEGFHAWQTQTFDFTANNTMETLYFLANGTPTGDPPFSLLADVSMVAVPEPKVTAVWTVLFGILIMAGNWAWRCRQQRETANA